MTIIDSIRIQTNRDAPPLHPGDRLTRAQFERMYAAAPNIKKAELIEGVVYMPSPTHHTRHGAPHFHVIGWLGLYSAATPGVSGSDNVTLRLDFENEVQPDALLRLNPALGGHSMVTEDDYLEGPPELIVEIAASSASYDMHQKRRAYARNGVPEYIVLLTYEERVIWYVLREGVYTELTPDTQGVLRSEIFPGLWLQADALIEGDLARVLAFLQQGIDSPEHQDYTARLQHRP